jgi:hypothetical protein
MNTTIALLAIVLLADPQSRSPIESRPVIPPRDPHPFGAIETRPLWERPAAEPFTLQQQAEDALDRGNGRIEDEQTFELRLQDRDRALRDARDFDLGRRPREAWERDRLERERRERLENRQRRIEGEANRQRRLERESDALADVRRRFAEEASRPNAALGAVVDRQGLAAIEQDYRAAIDAAARQHGAAVGAIDADAKLSAAERAARRAAADQQLEQSRDAAARRWEERRREVLGQK